MGAVGAKTTHTQDLAAWWTPDPPQKPELPAIEICRIANLFSIVLFFDEWLLGGVAASSCALGSSKLLNSKSVLCNNDRPRRST